MAQTKKRGRPVIAEGRPLRRNFRLSEVTDDGLVELARRMSTEQKTWTKTDALEWSVQQALYVTR